LIEIREFVDGRGRSPFAEWFNDLDPVAAARITMVLTRMQLGNLSNVKGVGAGVLERSVDFGPGYRLYFGPDGDKLLILLGGGTKRRQEQDIAAARLRWREYARRKTRG